MDIKFSKALHRFNEMSKTYYIQIITPDRCKLNITYDHFDFDTPYQVMDEILPMMGLTDAIDNVLNKNIYFEHEDIKKITDMTYAYHPLEYKSAASIYRKMLEQGYDDLTVAGKNMMRYDFSYFIKSWIRDTGITTNKYRESSISIPIGVFKEKTKIQYMTCISDNKQICIGRILPNEQ